MSTYHVFVEKYEQKVSILFLENLSYLGLCIKQIRLNCHQGYHIYPKYLGS